MFIYCPLLKELGVRWKDALKALGRADALKQRADALKEAWKRVKQSFKEAGGLRRAKKSVLKRFLGWHLTFM